MKENKEKQPYGAPQLTVVEFAMERGFASSPGQSSNNTENRTDGGLITNSDGDGDGWF